MNVGKVLKPCNNCLPLPLCVSFVWMCLFQGLSGLIHDNLTESKRTINLLQRMNIYQEVFLSVLYRLLPIQVSICCQIFTTMLEKCKR